MSIARVMSEQPNRTRRRARRGCAALALALVACATACVTPAEFRKLERRVTDLQRAGGSGTDGGRVAELGAQLDALQQSVADLQGRLEVNERRVQQALQDARAALEEASAAVETADPVGEASPGEAAVVDSEEVLAYREAHAAWRVGDSEACIDRFTKFLQTHPSSEYADDATYWLADCYFKQGNYSAAVLRFDDVARQYPSGNKAADALYRQGEALLRMGHGKAAGNAFEKVLQDYPDSARAPEAKKQLDLLESG
jgi:tol-pal system protein YbgF